VACARADHISSGVVRTGEVLARIISSAIVKRRMPPATLNAGMVIPKKWKIAVPAAAKSESTISAVRQARRAIARCERRCSPPTSARKTGTQAMGSTIENSEGKQRVKNPSAPDMRRG
jgi:hypothetical protein